MATWLKTLARRKNGWFEELTEGSIVNCLKPAQIANRNNGSNGAITATIWQLFGLSEISQWYAQNSASMSWVMVRTRGNKKLQDRTKKHSEPWKSVLQCRTRTKWMLSWFLEVLLVTFSRPNPYLSLCPSKWSGSIMLLDLIVLGHILVKCSFVNENWGALSWTMVTGFDLCWDYRVC